MKLWHRTLSWEIKLGETRLLQFSVQKTWPAIKFQVWKMKSVLLLQIVMVSPGTHLVKNHESWPITNQSQIEKKKGVILRPLCNQTVNLETDAKTLYTVNWYAPLNNSLRNDTTGCSTKRSSNHSIILCILQKEACLMTSWIILCLWEFFLHQGHRTQR